MIVILQCRSMGLLQELHRICSQLSEVEREFFRSESG